MLIMQFTIFTDGSSRGNPGPGGWGAIMIGDDKVIELGGRDRLTTNNRMELMAAIEALKKIKEGSEVVIYTDSSYLINGITKWVKGWKRTGWVTRTKDDVLNKDLWIALDSLALERNIIWEYVGGHVGIAGNERCDRIATGFADGDKIELYKGPLAGYPVANILDIKKAALKIETKSRRDAKAYSYVSAIKGIIEIHHSWAECEKIVKGVKGARYKKSLNAEDEERIIAEFEAL